MRRIARTLVLIGLLVVLGWTGAFWQREGRLPFMAGPADRSGAPAGAAVGGGAAAPAAPGNAASAAATRVPAGAASAAPAGTAGTGPAGANRPVTVNAQPARTMPIEDQIMAVGSLLAAQSVSIAAEIAGRITEVAIRDGDRVAQGASMFLLDDEVIAAELAQARAELNLAQANLKRTRDLARGNFVSERSRDEALSNVNVLQARMQVVSARLSRTVITAPFDGVAGLVAVSPGDYVTPGAPLVRLDDLSSLKVDLRVPERYFSRVRVGQPLRLSFDAWPARNFDARIETIDSQLDASGRSLVLRGRIDNHEGLLLPGMFARAQLVLESRQAAVVVPEESLEASSEGQHLYVVRDGRAHRTPVSTGARRDGWVEILEGVAAGEQVITAGQIKLRGTGMPVAIVAPVGTQPQDTR